MQIYGRRWLWRQVPLGEQNGGGRGFRGDLATIRRRWVVGYGRAAGSASADSVVRGQDWVEGGDPGVVSLAPRPRRGSPRGCWGSPTRGAGPRVSSSGC